MSTDPLNNELSLSAELSPTGVKAAAKSRFLAAVDRLLGGTVDLLNPRVEGIAQRARARNAADVDLIEALGAQRVAIVNADPEVARMTIDQHLGKIGRQRDNKAAVVTMALEDLREVPPTDNQNDAGPPELDPDFVNRFERYAEDATSEQLRERWGRVLAAEVRAPGTFSSKVLRSVDEMDAETARIFEQFVMHRLANLVPKALSGDLSFDHQAKLVSAGLMVEPGLGQSTLSDKNVDSTGTSHWLFGLGDSAISLSPSAAVKDPKNKFVQFDDEPGRPTIRVYVLTDAGSAIASILRHDEAGSVSALFSGMHDALSSGTVRRYRLTPDGKGYALVAELSAGTR